MSMVYLYFRKPFLHNFHHTYFKWGEKTELSSRRTLHFNLLPEILMHYAQYTFKGMTVKLGPAHIAEDQIWKQQRRNTPPLMQTLL